MPDAQIHGEPAGSTPFPKNKPPEGGSEWGTRDVPVFEPGSTQNVPRRRKDFCLTQHTRLAALNLRLLSAADGALGHADGSL